jgi:hypothetical protein
MIITSWHSYDPTCTEETVKQVGKVWPLNNKRLLQQYWNQNQVDRLTRHSRRIIKQSPIDTNRSPASTVICRGHFVLRVIESQVLLADCATFILKPSITNYNRVAADKFPRFGNFKMMSHLRVGPVSANLYFLWLVTQHWYSEYSHNQRFRIPRNLGTNRILSWCEEPHTSDLWQWTVSRIFGQLWYWNFALDKRQWFSGQYIWIRYFSEARSMQE